PGERGALEPLDQDDVGAAQIAPRQRDGVPFLRRPLEQHALARRFHQHALGLALVPVPPGVLAALVHIRRMRPVFDGHHAELAAHELGGERDQEGRLARVLQSDDGNQPRRRHTASARTRSSGVFTLKNSSAGSPNRRTSSRDRIPTRTSPWKAMARRSPASSRRSIAARQAGPYTAHSGSSPLRPSLSGRNASQEAAPRASARNNPSLMKGMSHATHSTGRGAGGDGPAATAV